MSIHNINEGRGKEPQPAQYVPTSALAQLAAELSVEFPQVRTLTRYVMQGIDANGMLQAEVTVDQKGRVLQTWRRSANLSRTEQLRRGAADLAGTPEGDKLSAMAMADEEEGWRDEEAQALIDAIEEEGS